MKFLRLSLAALLGLAAALTLVSATALFSLPAYAQKAVTIPISTGSETGSYFRFGKEAAALVPSVNIRIQTSSGSTQNLDRLEANEASLAIVQLDVLDLYSKTRDMSNVRVVVPLFPEQVHFITRANLGQKEGGYGIGSFKIGAKDVVLNTAADLAGRRVGAAGGSFYTAQVIAYLAPLQMNLQEIETPDAVVARVISGELDAGILVGAQPLGTITKMGDRMAELKLLPVPDDLAGRVAKIYSKAQPLSYRQMGAGGNNVPTIEVKSALVTQNYRKGPMAEAVAEFRRGLFDVAEEQSATPGTHPAWRNVKPGAQSSWPMWEPPVELNKAPLKASAKK